MRPTDDIDDTYTYSVLAEDANPDEIAEALIPALGLEKHFILSARRLIAGLIYAHRAAALQKGSAGPGKR